MPRGPVRIPRGAVVEPEHAIAATSVVPRGSASATATVPRALEAAQGTARPTESAG